MIKRQDLRELEACRRQHSSASATRSIFDLPEFAGTEDIDPSAARPFAASDLFLQLEYDVTHLGGADARSGK